MKYDINKDDLRWFKPNKDKVSYLETLRACVNVKVCGMIIPFGIKQ